MKKAKIRTADEEMLDEYDFSGGVRGKYFKQYQDGTNIVALDPDVFKAFPDSKSVNSALRALLKIARRAKTTRRMTSAAH